MNMLIAATALVVVSHAVPLLPGVREALCHRLGRRTYLGLHSAVSLLALLALVMAWRATDPAPSPFELGEGAKQLAVLMMPLAFILIAARLRQRQALTPNGTPYGIYSITAVPGSLGTLIWAGLHLAAVSDARAAAVFAGFAVIALLALAKNLRAASVPLRQVGPVPFAASLAGRVRVDWQGVGLAPLLWGLAAWGLLLWLHPLVLGPDPLVWLLH